MLNSKSRLYEQPLSTDEWYESFGVKPVCLIRQFRTSKNNSVLSEKDSLFGKRKRAPKKDGLLNPLWNLRVRRDRVFLEFDDGIRLAAEAAQKALRFRNKPCSDVQKQGWAGQFAFDSYLNEIGVYRLHDNPLYSPKPEICDFWIPISDQGEKSFEVKTTQYGEKYKELRVYYTNVLPNGKEIVVWKKPDIIIAIKCMKSDLTLFEICGWTTSEILEKLRNSSQFYKRYDEGERWGIPLENHKLLYNPRDLNRMLAGK